MDDLVAELERAEEGSRELSDKVLLASGWTIKQYETRKAKVPYDWITPDGKGVVAFGEQPDPTRNVQDALDRMVPEGWQPLGIRWFVGHVSAAVCNIKKAEGIAKSPALALVIACLKARTAAPTR